MKYVFVGDIHGKVQAVEAALAREGRKVFVGDFIDSYDRSVEDHKQCYDLVLDAIERDEANAIFGNHELSYLIPAWHRCSGFNKQREMLMNHYKKQLNEAFLPYLLIGDRVLVSHAGLTKQIWKEQELTLELLPRILEEWWPNHSSPMHWVGAYRGGQYPYGGMFWCDYNAEFKPVPGLTQIFGHTRGKGLRAMGDNYCIDCLDYKNVERDEYEFLELDL